MNPSRQDPATIGANILTRRQRWALNALRARAAKGYDPPGEAVARDPGCDRYMVWMHWQTAEALERRGLVSIDRCGDGWDVRLAGEHGG